MNQIDCMQWEETLREYLGRIENELAEVRKAKYELYNMQRQLQEGSFRGRYERDEDTIIISAPNIIIGNVDKQGNLLDKQSRVIIRSNGIDLEGVGTCDGGTVAGGSVVTRARYVNVQTVDPGPDGRECVAFPDSTFSVQSASVSLLAEEIGDNNAKKSDKINNNGGVFTLKTGHPVGTITLAAEQTINVSSVKAKAAEGKGLSTVIGDLDKKATDAGNAANNNITAIADSIKSLSTNEDDKELSLIGKLGENADSFALRTGLYKYDERSQVTKVIALEMAQNISQCITNLSTKAEAKRIKEYLEIRNEKLTTLNTDYDKKATGATVNINAENVNISTRGADGKVRTNEGNGVKIVSQNTEIVAQEGTKTIEKSTLKVIAHDVKIDTSEYTYKQDGEKYVPESSKSTGNIEINSFKVFMTSQDRTYDTKSGEIKTTELTPNSYIWQNSGDIYLDMCKQADGVAEGNCVITSKNIFIGACNLDKQKHQAGVLTSGGQVVITGENVFAGTYEDRACNSVVVRSKNSFLTGHEEVDIYKDSGATKDKGTALSGSLLKINADVAMKCTNLTTVAESHNLWGVTTVHGDFKSTCKIDCSYLNATTAIYGPNLSDNAKTIAQASIKESIPSLETGTQIPNIVTAEANAAKEDKKEENAGSAGGGN